MPKLQGTHKYELNEYKTFIENFEKMKFEPTDFEILKPIIHESITQYFEERENKEFEKKIFNITQTSDLLGKAYNWVSERMKEGVLKTTIDGKHVTGKEINNYLGIQETL